MSTLKAYSMLFQCGYTSIQCTYIYSSDVVWTDQTSVITYSTGEYYGLKRRIIPSIYCIIFPLLVLIVGQDYFHITETCYTINLINNSILLDILLLNEGMGRQKWVSYTICCYNYNTKIGLLHYYRLDIIIYYQAEIRPLV